MPTRPSLPPAFLSRALWAGLVLMAATAISGCLASHHATRASALGERVDLARLDSPESALNRPGPIRFTRVAAADWAVARSGLVNLDHPRARAAGIEDGPESIEVFFYVLEHPEFGDFLVDSGVSSDFRREGGNPAVSALVESVMDTQSLVIHTTTAEWLATRRKPVAGVFLTHIHLDHVMGLPDVPRETPIYVGPGEMTARAFLNLFTRGTIDRMLGEEREARVWPFRTDRGEAVVDAVDVFGDASLFALHVPGHTPGSVAFLVRTTGGPRLLVGDASHTRWGWENDVEPGTFTADHEKNAKSLAWLRAFAERHPEVEVHLGHQRIEAR